MWFAESKARIFFDMHLPSWPDKGIAEKFDTEELASAFVDSGADSVILYAKCQYGNFYTEVPGEVLHPGLAGSDLLEKTALALNEKDVKSLAYYSVSWDEHVAESRPEWLAVNAKGERGKGQYRWKTLCINSPYADLVEAHIRAIAAKPIDGIWLDMTIFGDGNCYCPRCRALFREQKGYEIPSGPEDPRYPDFLTFRYDIVERFYTRIAGAARAVRPDVAFTNNYWGYPYSSTAMGSRAVGAVAQTDFLTGEAYTDWTGIRSTSFLPIFLRGAAAGRPYESLIGRFINTWDYTKKPSPFLAYEAFAVFAHGATVTVDDQPYFDGSIDRELYTKDLKEIFASLRSLRESTLGSHLPYAAIYHSQESKDLARDQTEFIKDISGAFRMLRDLHWQVDFVFDESLTLESLRKFKALLLPNVNEIRAAQWEILDAWVKEGGFILASGTLGGKALSGKIQQDLRIETLGPSEFTVSYLKLSPSDPRPVLVRGAYARYAANEGSTGEILDPICETDSIRFFHNNLPSPYMKSTSPGLIERNRGSGAIALFPQAVFRHYAKEPSLELRQAIKRLVEGRVGTPPVELGIPMKMDYSIVSNGATVYVHLLNSNAEPSLCCGLMDTLDGAFERSYEYMEEVVPVSDLRIFIRAKDLISVETMREGSGVKVAARDGGFEILVDRVSLWEVVRIRLGAALWE